MNIFNIGDIAHWDNPQRVRGLFRPGEAEGDNFTTKLYQQFQIADVHAGEAGPYYSGWLRHKGRLLYLESVPFSRLIGKSTWALSEQMRTAHPDSYPISTDFEDMVCTPPPEGQVYVLQGSISSDDQEDHTVLGVSCAPVLLQNLMSKDLLSKERNGEIGRSRIPDTLVCIGAVLGQFHLSWSAEWENLQSAHYTIVAAPLLTDCGEEEQDDVRKPD